DVYPLRPVVSGRGAGRIGRLPQAASVQELGQRLKKSLGALFVQVVGEPARSVERVAMACGAAGEFLADAVAAGAHVFVTGEMRFHDYLAARAQNIALLLPGHYATERFGVEALAELLEKAFPGIHVSASRREHDPVSLVI